MRTRNFYYILILILVMSGCKKVIHDPETMDPVYSDLLSDAEKTKKDIEAKEKELEANKDKLKETADGGYEKKVLRDEIFHGENEIAKLKQKQKFLEVSAESRQIYVRKEYLETFKKDKEWDPKRSAELYFKNKELQASSRHWDRGAASVKNAKPKKEEHKSEEGHE